MAHPTGSTLSHLECTACGRTFDADAPHRLCEECGKVLYPRYDLAKVALRPSDLVTREPSMWRYRELLPVRDAENVISLGEGFTPLLSAPRLSARLGIADVRIKDEGQNPTGSFKARGMSAAVSRARELGAQVVAAPSAGNAGGALAAYAARAGLAAGVVMPEDCPRINQVEAVVAGADTWLVDGLIDDAGRLVRTTSEARGWFDVSTLKEPYRVEGKKTLGYELAEQLGWQLPDVVIYPTGGGTGLVGMWKAFAEMTELGWIGEQRPRMVVVQAEGCAPIVRAHDQGERHAPRWEDAATDASGLRVPVAVGDYLILDAVRDSGGTAVSVSEDDMRDATRELASSEGIHPAPEGAATLAALRRLRDSGEITGTNRVVLFNTGAGQKYPDFVPASPEVVPADSPAWGSGL
ncbi:threonine synthase [Saccharopolyspora dendranthemae]|uniref:Threonine synthase n=1 Tax=Saccharopolyspora dendranthemae TaxID=1181886 RepID=A0A561U5Y4_9PSEU|nr:threonine synthase [Saccharopolyspora dendranthemae]TWF94770.1 threonine synthase [Saccharopolyspora dendranthemae]